MLTIRPPQFAVCLIMRHLMAGRQSELEEKLRGIMKTDEWRVQRMARTEISRADALSSVEAMKQVQSQTGTLIEKAMESETGQAV